MRKIIRILTNFAIILQNMELIIDCESSKVMIGCYSNLFEDDLVVPFVRLSKIFVLISQLADKVGEIISWTTAASYS